MTITIEKMKNGYSVSASRTSKYAYSDSLRSGTFVTETEDTLLDKIRLAMADVDAKHAELEQEKKNERK